MAASIVGLSIINVFDHNHRTYLWSAIGISDVSIRKVVAIAALSLTATHAATNRWRSITSDCLGTPWFLWTVDF